MQTISNHHQERAKRVGSMHAWNPDPRTISAGNLTAPVRKPALELKIFEQYGNPGPAMAGSPGQDSRYRYRTRRSAQAGYVARRRFSKMAAIFASELRRAFVTHAEGGSLDVDILDEH
jgi:hypothetical protein